MVFGGGLNRLLRHSPFGKAKRRAGSRKNPLAAALIARADAARDVKNYREAAILYKEALRLVPGNAAIHIQCGHMFKESGDLPGAELHYTEARRLTPQDADLALQLGHFFKVAGRLDEATASYSRAAELRPGWSEPAAELAHLQRSGWQGRGSATAAPPRPHDSRQVRRDVLDFGKEAASIEASFQIDRLVPEIVPRKPGDMLLAHHDSICLRRLGRPQRSAWGMLPALRGVEALRGFCISSVPIHEVQIFLGGLLIHRGPLKGGYKLRYERDNHDLRKYVFNVWHDFSPYAQGRREIEFRFIDVEQGRRTYHDHVVIAAPLSEIAHPNSDGVITLTEVGDRTGGSIDDVINARPSVVRPARRSLFPEPIRNVLIVRTDQLGDMVTSIPAMRRLRELLPEARFVGLLTSSNAEFAATLKQLDEIIVIDFPDDKIDRKRTMPFEAQEELRRRLAPYRFDIAIDLAESSMSRPLLLLTGAAFTYGFYDREWPWLSAGFEGNSHDPKNHGEVAPHSTRVLAFVERFGALLGGKVEVIRRPELTRDSLGQYGIAADDRFVVLHAGARIEFSRWPYYQALARLYLQNTDMTVLLITDDPDARGSLSEDLAGSARFRLLDRRLPFDDFDALLSFCSLFVGNDSGPKHLASLRGANVVSIHSARVNWSEWGQELVGSIISRKVPCAGCAIYHDDDECGKDYVCVVNILPQEVFDASMRLL